MSDEKRLVWLSSEFKHCWNFARVAPFVTNKATELPCVTQALAHKVLGLGSLSPSVAIETLIRPILL